MNNESVINRDETIDPAKYYFVQIGSSFIRPDSVDLVHSIGTTSHAVGKQDPASPTGLASMGFTNRQLQSVFDLVKQIIKSETMESIDSVAAETYSTILQTNKPHPYKTFSEALRLVLLVLLRDVLRHQSELDGSFARKLQEFSNNMYDHGQVLLHSHDRKASTNQRISSASFSSSSHFNATSLVVRSNVACIELHFWASNDESAAESLCSRLTGKLTTSPDHRNLLIHSPLLLASLKVSALSSSIIIAY